MRMYAVHSEYEAVVSEKSSAMVRRGEGGSEKSTCLCGIWSYLSGSTAVLINWG